MHIENLSMQLPKPNLEMDHLDVVVITVTYNHEAFIEQCLNSVLTQEFSGTLGLVIFNDCSTDQTPQKIHECLERFRDKPIEVRVINAADNFWSKGAFPFKRIVNAMSPKYIALCDGDDAWSDVSKIQKQFDFLEANKSFVACGHNSTVVDVNYDVQSDSKLPPAFQRDYSPAELKRCACWLLTNTLFFRGGISIPEKIGTVVNEDRVLWSTLGSYGGFKYMQDVEPSIYRVHAGGVWSPREPLDQILTQSGTDLRLSQYHLSEGDQQTALHMLLAVRKQLDRIR
ncbi:glycosyltransferase family 2 protein [Epibacterium sp. MM17-32]|uniref:glycosyltransferase family 2 protein n=1 Tax=Epibacterium sp. MM17-32 TaxID=2917734 RepID=UPI001EF62756|nr:glycosyltransferase family A protein [Epibacterium sp. MM17-32]MCG7628820.1 glycosyltransferase family 2 protein [Epibacterium sp. MM17-32]